MKNENITWAFFGSSEAGVIVLDELKARGFIPALVITGEDKPRGRNLVLTAPEVKVWAEKEKIPCIQPKTLRNGEVIEEIKKYSASFDLFVLFSYGKIIPKSVLDMPKHGILNLHPSLLPRLRGPSPIKSAILSEDQTGVTIIKLDEEMDHGPIVAQKKIDMAEWPPYEKVLEETLAHEGGKLLAEAIPDWLAGNITAREQEHSHATYCAKIQKADGEIDLNDNPEKNLRKIRAYHRWPTAYFFTEHKEKKTRIIVKTAHIENSSLVLDRIVPEGKKEMNWSDFKKSFGL